jgi:hypothetical protein
MLLGRRDSRASAIAISMVIEPQYVFGADTGWLYRYREMKSEHGT